MVTTKAICEFCHKREWVSTRSGPSVETEVMHTCHACHSQVMEKMACKEWEPITVSQSAPKSQKETVFPAKPLTIQEVAEEMVRRDNDRFLKKQAAEAAARNEAAAARAAEAAGEAGKRDKWEAVKV